jgi:hypothetical protein
MSADRSLAVRIPSSQATSLATRRNTRSKSELSAVPDTFLDLIPSSSYSLINLLRAQLGERVLIASRRNGALTQETRADSHRRAHVWHLATSLMRCLRCDGVKTVSAVTSFTRDPRSKREHEGLLQPLTRAWNTFRRIVSKE